MRLRFGRYAGMTAEILLLRTPDYATWTMEHRPGSALAGTFVSLAAAFDARQFQALCRCGGRARYARAYRNSIELILLCGGCAERQPVEEVQADVTSYAAAIEHVRRTCARGRRRQQRQIIRRLGLAKGMPPRVTESAASAFLDGTRRLTARLP